MGGENRDRRQKRADARARHAAALRNNRATVAENVATARKVQPTARGIFQEAQKRKAILARVQEQIDTRSGSDVKSGIQILGALAPLAHRTDTAA